MGVGVEVAVSAWSGGPRRPIPGGVDGEMDVPCDLCDDDDGMFGHDIFREEEVYDDCFENTGRRSGGRASHFTTVSFVADGNCPANCHGKEPDSVLVASTEAVPTLLLILASGQLKHCHMTKHRTASLLTLFSGEIVLLLAPKI